MCFSFALLVLYNVSTTEMYFLCNKTITERDKLNSLRGRRGYPYEARSFVLDKTQNLAHSRHSVNTSQLSQG